MRHHEDARVGQVLADGLVKCGQLAVVGQAEAGRYLASRIAGAHYLEQPGDHSLRFAGSGDNDTLFREVASFLAAL